MFEMVVLLLGKFYIIPEVTGGRFVDYVLGLFKGFVDFAIGDGRWWEWDDDDAAR